MAVCPWRTYLPGSLSAGSGGDVDRADTSATTFWIYRKRHPGS